MISMIVCKTSNNAIGINGSLPWKQKHDMQRFKSITANKALIVGRKTWESFGGKPLPNRLSHAIFTRNSDAYPDDSLPDNVYTTTKELFTTDYVHYSEGNQEYVVIGGAEIYAQFMDQASTLYVTELDVELPGDAFFPDIDLSQWKLFAREEYKSDEMNEYDYKFLTYVRIKDAT